MVFSAGGSEENLDRNLRDITGKQDTGNIVIANSFERLMEDTKSPAKRQENIRSEVNKENEIHSNPTSKGKSVAHGVERIQKKPVFRGIGSS